LLLALPLAFAGSFDFILNPLSQDLSDLEWNSFGSQNSVILREGGFESGGEFIVDFKGNDSFLFPGSFTESSFLFKALRDSTKEFNLTAVGGNCKAVFYQSFGSGIQRHVFSSEGKVLFSLSEGDKIFFGLVPSDIGECIVKFNDGNKFFSAVVSFKFYPELYDFIKADLYETDSCKQTFRNEETGVELCYDEWMAWGCSNEEFLAGTLEAKANCFARQKTALETEKDLLLKQNDELKSQTPEGLALKIDEWIGAERAGASQALARAEKEESNFETLLGGLLVIVYGANLFIFWRSSRDEDFSGLSESKVLEEKVVQRIDLPKEDYEVNYGWDY